MLPGSSQLDAKIALVRPTCDQDRPKVTPKSLQVHSPRPPKSRKCRWNAIVVLIFILRPFWQRSLPRPPKIAPKTHQVASRCPAKLHLGQSWRHLGAILAPSSPILPPFWASRACPKLAKICQDCLQDGFHAKIVAKTYQTRSRP